MILLSCSTAKLAGAADETAVNSASELIAGALEDQFLSVDARSSDGLNIFAVTEQFTGLEAVYGAGNGYFFIASDERAVEDVFSGEASLSDNESYQAVWDEFPGDVSPVLYVDISGAMDAADQAGSVIGGSVEEAIPLLGPIEFLALGSDLGSDVSRLTLIVFLES